MSNLLARTGLIAVPRPNWSGGYNVSYSFKTGFFVSANGKERREALRQTGRQNISFDTLLTLAEINRVQRDLALAQNRNFLARSEVDRLEVAAGNVAGNTVLTMSEIPSWALPGEKMILTTATNEVAVEIFSVSGDIVTLVDPLPLDIETGTVAHRAYTVRMTTNAAFRVQTSNVWTGSVTFEVEPGLHAQPASAHTGLTFEGKEVFLTKPNWIDTPQVAFADQRDEFDPGRGRRFDTTQHLTGSQTLRFGYTGLNRAASDDLVDFFLRQKGQRGSFWMPTRNQDLTPATTAVPGSSVFSVAGSEFGEAYTDHPVYNVMIAFFDDGNVQINRVADITTDTDSTITFTDNWTHAVGPSTRVMWLPRWRHLSDTLDLRWLTRTVAETQFVVKTIYNEAP